MQDEALVQVSQFICGRRATSQEFTSEHEVHHLMECIAGSCEEEGLSKGVACRMRILWRTTMWAPEQCFHWRCASVEGARSKSSMLQGRLNCNS